ncbi:glutaredoxin domain-containing protein [Actinotalea sp.]|uniref:glutaredoxin family protein n=1 Tax=Actinotalea sp. TaxID=1872145 RepID=UPI002CEDACB7|nr:glutaredoxin domain-containing protein [Actinotalea sp.]HQY32792.1 glutaredoxin domain-containing protein [Actinotalea sp.]HRA49698.1 glutaredoxin domain-containing protein [Actinotalea sp.]
MSPTAPTPASASAVTVYGADWCGDCLRSKALLEREGVPYAWVDLVADPERTAEVVRRNGGRQSIPVIVFPDDSHLTEPSDPQLRTRLADLGLLPA